MNILIVDDIDTNRRLLRAMLEAEGHCVSAASHGGEALRLLREQPVDAVVSDILMPTMDGYKLCYEMRSDSCLSNIPLIFYTSTYTSPGDRQLADTMGADGYLTKPQPVDVLLRSIEEALLRIGRADRPRPSGPENLEIMKEYNQVLVRKLEEKNADLERALAKLEARNRHISDLNAELERRVYKRTAQLFLKTQELEVEVEERKRAHEESERLVAELEIALAEVKTLSGLIPICAWCKKIRNDEGYWLHLEEYLAAHTDATFSHGICTDCIPKFRASAGGT